MSSATTQAASYYVKVDGRIRGPYATTILEAMLKSGRINPHSEVSVDRSVWFAIERLGGPFAAGSPSQSPAPAADQPWTVNGSTALIVPPSAPESIPPANHIIAPPAIQGQCFYSIDGVEHGPVPFSVLQQRATSGLLSPYDPVWVEGQPNWGPAGTLPGLVFPAQKSRWGGWVSRHPALSVCLALAFLILFVGPIAFVFAKARHEEGLRQEAITRQKEAEEKIESEFKELAAQLESRRRDALDREAQARKDLTQLIVQYDMLDERIQENRLQNLRDARTEQRFDDVKNKIREVEEQANRHAAEARAADERRAAADQERRDRLDDIKRKQDEINDRLKQRGI